MNADRSSEQKLIEDVERWLHDCVLGLALCPYARAPLQSGRVRLIVVKDEIDCSQSLPGELQRMQVSDIETTLMILSTGLADFLDFNDWLGDVEEWLEDAGLAVHFQLVGFHPAYMFAGERQEDPGNFTNRSPYPVVQILRAASVAKAAEDGKTEAIPKRNLITLRALSSAQLRSLFPWS